MSHRIPRRILAALPAAALASSALAGLVPEARAQSAGGESTFDRVSRTKVLRVNAIPGALPYYSKDLASGEWKGAAVEMARDFAKLFDAKLEYVETTYGNSVLDLQSNKIDIGFFLNPTPQRALAISFSDPLIIHPFGCIARHGLDPKTWGDLNKPDLRVSFDIGSLHDTCAHHFTPKAQLLGFKGTDDCVLAVQSGRADVEILAAIIGLAAAARNPQLAPFHLLTDPLVSLPSSVGLRRESDSRFAQVLNAWIAYNRGLGQIREWLLAGLELQGIKREDLPPQLTF